MRQLNYHLGDIKELSLFYSYIPQRGNLSKDDTCICLKGLSVGNFGLLSVFACSTSATPAYTEA